MASIPATMVFSNVVATLSSTFLDQIDGNKKEFLSNLLTSEHVDLLNEPSNEVFTITGLLEDIVLCQEKLANVMRLCNIVEGLDARSVVNSKHSVQLDSNVCVTDTYREVKPQKGLCAEKEAKIDGQQIEICNETVPQVAKSNSPDVINESKGKLVRNAKKRSVHKTKHSSNVSIMQQQYEKALIQNPKDTFDDRADIKNTAEKIVTKRGRVVKRPPKLDSSILLLEREDRIPGLDGPQSPVHRKTKVPKQTMKMIKQAYNRTAKLCVTGVFENEPNKETDQVTEIVDGPGTEEDASTFQAEDIALNQNADEQLEDKTDENKIKEKDEKKRMRRHYEDAMPFKYFCSQCSYKSKRESHYNAHMRLHESNPDLKLIRCEKCDFTCIRQSLLKRHMLSHEPDVEMLQCESCKYKTDSQTSLSLHVSRNHNGQKKTYNYKHKWKCSFCVFRTYSKVKLMKHLSNHASKTSNNASQSFSCDECSYSTSKRVHLDRHKRNVHSDRRPYLCDLCGAAFKRTDTLAAHKITHVDVSMRNLPYVCGICNKRFKSKAHLITHMSVHSSVRAYQCHICGQMFKTRQVQKKHQENIHYNPRSFKCSVCKKEFNTKYTLQRHVRTHDSDLLNTANGDAEELAKKGLDIFNENKNVANKGSMGEAADSLDENASAIQHITLSEFTSHLQNASDQLQSGSDISTIYIEGLETVVQETGAINIVDVNGQNIQQIFIPPRSRNVETQPVHPDQYLTQISTAPSGDSVVSESESKADHCDMTNQDLSEIYVSTVTLQDEEADLGNSAGEIEGVYIQTDPNNPDIRHILVSSKYQTTNVEAGTDRTGEMVMDIDRSHEYSCQS